MTLSLPSIIGLEHSTKPARGRLRPAPVPFGAAETVPEHGQIHQRNGIWVVTINGIWRGDYIKRENALAAVESAGFAARSAFGGLWQAVARS